MPFPPTAGTFNLARVLASASAPNDPEEVLELAAVDVASDESGPGVGAVRSRLFDALGPEDGSRGAMPCTPMDVAGAVWGDWTPDVLVAHDASAATAVFGPALTRRLPWVSLHKVARRIWPTAQSYQLEPLASWRSEVGWTTIRSSLPSGAAREADLSAQLLVAMLADPALRALGRAADGQESARQRRADAVLADLCRADALQAAVRVSAAPSEPLRRPPAPWDDQRDWAGVGVADLHHFATGGQDRWVAEAAREELARRARLATGDEPTWHGLILRRTGPIASRPGGWGP